MRFHWDRYCWVTEGTSRKWIRGTDVERNTPGGCYGPFAPKERLWKTVQFRRRRLGEAGRILGAGSGPLRTLTHAHPRPASLSASADVTASRTCTPSLCHAALPANHQRDLARGRVQGGHPVRRGDGQTFHRVSSIAITPKPRGPDSTPVSSGFRFRRPLVGSKWLAAAHGGPAFRVVQNRAHWLCEPRTYGTTAQ